MRRKLYIVRPTNIDRGPDGKSSPQTAAADDALYYETEADAWIMASRTYSPGSYDLVLVYEWDILDGLTLKGSIGRQRASSNYAFPGSMQECQAFNADVAMDAFNQFRTTLAAKVD